MKKCIIFIIIGGGMIIRVLVWELRQARQLSLRGLEKMTGISKTTLNRIENGDISPTLWQLEQIARGLGCKICDLFISAYK